MVFHRLALEGDLAREVVLRVLVIGSLDIDIRLDGAEHRLGAGFGADAGEVHDPDRGQHLGAHMVGEYGPSGALVDVGVRRDGHDQDVAFTFGRFQMADVAEMHQVEHAMAQDHCLALGLGGPGDRRELFDRQQFGARGLLGLAVRSALGVGLFRIIIHRIRSLMRISRSPCRDI